MAHIIVIFDRSGSMGEPFHALQRAGKRKHRHHETKIEAAKSALMDWLLKSAFDTVTIIPFSSKVERKITSSLRKSLTRIQNFIYRQTPGGETNLQAAISRAVKTASKDAGNSYLQYLIVTDGLSQTREQDIKLVQTLPISQGISGILIDPTPEGESHLRQLCVRGSYISVSGIGELAKGLERQGKSYDERIRLSKSVTELASRSKATAEKLSNFKKRIENFPRLDKALEKVTTSSTNRASEVQGKAAAIINEIADQRIDISQITKDSHEIEQEQANLETVVNLIRMYEQLLRQLKISVSHPRWLAKGHTTNFLIYVYPVDNQIKDLNREIRKLGAAKRLYSSVLTAGMSATTKLECQGIKFSNAITKKFSAGKNILKFSAKPDAGSKPGLHEVTLVIYNNRTAKEYVLKSVKLELVDYAIGKISRPWLIRWGAILLIFVSLATIACIMFRIINVLAGSLISTISGLGAITGLIFYMRDFVRHETYNNS